MLTTKLPPVDYGGEDMPDYFAVLLTDQVLIYLRNAADAVDETEAFLACTASLTSQYVADKINEAEDQLTQKGCFYYPEGDGTGVMEDFIVAQFERFTPGTFNKWMAEQKIMPDMTCEQIHQICLAETKTWWKN